MYTWITFIVLGENDFLLQWEMYWSQAEIIEVNVLVDTLCVSLLQGPTTATIIWQWTAMTNLATIRRARTEPPVTLTARTRSSSGPPTTSETGPRSKMKISKICKCVLQCRFDWSNFVRLFCKPFAMNSFLKFKRTEHKNYIISNHSDEIPQNKYYYVHHDL